jgi:16S rRNA (guanine966-N2)-methyltransferase
LSKITIIEDYRLIIEDLTNMNNPRITTGDLKGLKLKVPKGARPFTERVKRVMFDTILGYLKDTRCLDMFSGSGSIGIEAISRGAAYCVFVDNDIRAMDILKDNLKQAKIESKTKTIVMEYRKYIHWANETFDIVFLDPPFDSIPYINLNSIEKLLNPEGLVVFKSETGIVPKFPAVLKLLLEKKVGSNTLYFLQLASSN